MKEREKHPIWIDPSDNSTWRIAQGQVPCVANPNNPYLLLYRTDENGQVERRLLHVKTFSRMNTEKVIRGLGLGAKEILQEFEDAFAEPTKYPIA